MRLLLVLLLVWLGISHQYAFGQKQNNVWYFGINAGLDFNGPKPVAVPGGQTGSPAFPGANPAGESSCIADRNTGAILFYTDGVLVWNRRHILMPNGTGLKGGGPTGSHQPAVVVPMPGDSNRYYIFTAASVITENNDGLNHSIDGINYSIVDMSLTGGDGDVAVKNIQLVQPASEKLCAVKLCDGSGFWVIAHGWLDDSFYAYKITSSGASNPVISAAGILSYPGAPNAFGDINCLRTERSWRPWYITTIVSFSSISIMRPGSFRTG